MESQSNSLLISWWKSKQATAHPLAACTHIGVRWLCFADRRPPCCRTPAHRLALPAAFGGCVWDPGVRDDCRAAGCEDPAGCRRGSDQRALSPYACQAWPHGSGGGCGGPCPRPAPFAHHAPARHAPHHQTLPLGHTAQRSCWQLTACSSIATP